MKIWIIHPKLRAAALSGPFTRLLRSSLDRNRQVKFMLLQHSGNF